MTATDQPSVTPPEVKPVPERRGKVRWVRLPADWYNGILELTPYLPDGTLGKPTEYEVEFLEDLGWNLYPQGKPTTPYTCYRIRRKPAKPTAWSCNCPDALNRGCECKHVLGLRAGLRKIIRDQQGEF